MYISFVGRDTSSTYSRVESLAVSKRFISIYKSACLHHLNAAYSVFPNNAYYVVTSKMVSLIDGFSLVERDS
jgi:hypothetical protein